MQRTTLPDGTRIVIKQRRDAPADFFHAEARGLAALRDVHALRVPEVFEVADDQIVLEDLGDGARATHYWQRAGAGLGRQHCSIGTHFGFNHDGFCGDSPQDNTPDDDGRRFFAGRRVLPQMGRFKPTGVNPKLVHNVRDALDREGFGHVKIVVSGGFTVDKIRQFESEGVPVDGYGVGSSLFQGRFDFTADVVRVDGRAWAKVGRGVRPNPRLGRVT